MKKLWILSLLFLFLINQGFAADLFSCRIESSGICNFDESSIFYLNKFFHQQNDPLKILSSKVSLSLDTSYSSPICCKISKEGLGKVEFNSNILVNESCPVNSKELLFFTNSYNGKIGFPDSPNFSKLNYTNKLCVKVPKTFSSLDIIVNETDYSYAGYSCLFRTNQLQNSLVSSCDATFNGGIDYTYTAWARLWENTGSLKCNNDCTSKLDNRVYSACSQKILSCQGIPQACNGAVSGSWVNLNNSYDVKCLSPWNNYKYKAFTNQTISVKTFDESKCLNLIKRKYSVILNNELVTMNIYVCNN